MMNEIHKVIKESSLTIEQKKYVMSLVFQDIANKEINAVLKDLEPLKQAEPELVSAEGAE